MARIHLFVTVHPLSTLLICAGFLVAVTTFALIVRPTQGAATATRPMQRRAAVCSKPVSRTGLGEGERIAERFVEAIRSARDALAMDDLRLFAAGSAPVADSRASPRAGRPAPAAAGSRRMVSPP